ncbi:MAG: LPP20 family lipoprotein [Desulfohalobiaceae bacterium]
MKWKHLLPILFAGLALVAACGGASKKPTVGMWEIPEWVAQPQVEQGIAVTECVPASKDFSMDRKEAVANARQSLAQQIRTKVQAMDKTYQRRVKAEDQSTSGSTFESLSKQLTEETLQETNLEKMGYEKFKNQKHFCVMLTMGGNEMQEFFNRLVEQSNREIGARDEEILYQEFKAKQAQEEMEEDLSGSNN